MMFRFAKTFFLAYFVKHKKRLIYTSKKACAFMI
jgi:hypothetical protein